MVQQVKRGDFQLPWFFFLRGGDFFLKMYSLGILCVVFFLGGGKIDKTGWVLIDCRFFSLKDNSVELQVV